MAGYSGTPLYAKLGIKPESKVCVLHCPSSVIDTLSEAPFPVTIASLLEGSFDVILYFATQYDDLAGDCELLISSLESAGGLWIAWPKRASKVPTDITEDRLRDLFLPSTPMVDNKVCAIDEVWSGLRFVRRREFR